MLTITKDEVDVTVPLTAKVARIAQEQAITLPEDPNDQLFTLANIMMLSMIGHGYLTTVAQVLELMPALRQEIALAMSAIALLDRTIKKQDLTVERLTPEDVVPANPQTVCDNTDAGTNQKPNCCAEGPSPEEWEQP